MSDPFWGYEHSNFFEFWNSKNLVNMKKVNDDFFLSVDDGSNNPIVRIKMTKEDFALFLRYGTKFLENKAPLV